MCDGFVERVVVNMWGCVYTRIGIAWSVKHLGFLICIGVHTVVQIPVHLRVEMNDTSSVTLE